MLVPPRRSIEEDRGADTQFEITCSMVEIYNEVVHDLLSDDAKRQVELQKTATGFDIPAITTIGAPSAGLVLGSAVPLSQRFCRSAWFSSTAARLHTDVTSQAAVPGRTTFACPTPIQLRSQHCGLHFLMKCCCCGCRCVVAGADLRHHGGGLRAPRSRLPRRAPSHRMCPCHKALNSPSRCQLSSSVRHVSCC